MCLIFAMGASVGTGVERPVAIESLGIVSRRPGMALAALNGPRLGYARAPVTGASRVNRSKQGGVIMNVGISVPLPAYLVDVGFMAHKVEELGFESFWCAEHPFIPVHSKSRFPGSADGVIPESYRHFID